MIRLSIIQCVLFLRSEKYWQVGVLHHQGYHISDITNLEYKVTTSLLIVTPEGAHVRQWSSEHFLLQRGEDLDHWAGETDTGSAGLQVPQTVLQRGLLEPHQGGRHHGC